MNRSDNLESGTIAEIMVYPPIAKTTKDNGIVLYILQDNQQIAIKPNADMFRTAFSTITSPISIIHDALSLDYYLKVKLNFDHFLVLVICEY